MVRKNNGKATIKTSYRIAFLTIGIVLTGVIIYTIIALRNRAINTYTQKLDEVTRLFETAEKTYTSSYTTLISKRTSVDTAALSGLTYQYSRIQETLTSLTEVTPEKIQLQEIVALRLGTVATLTSLNTVITTESALGTALDNYAVCQKNVNFSTRPDAILLALSSCETFITASQRAALEIPEYAYSSCAKEASPLYIVQLYGEAFTFLKNEYQLAAQSNLVGAAAAEQQYKSKMAAIQALPKWNSCISTYLQKTSESLIPKE